MASNDDVIKVVQEAVRQFGQDIQHFDVDIVPAIVLSNAPPKIDVISKVQGATLTDAVQLSHATARKWARRAVVCVETWDGYVTIDGERSDAVLVNYWTEGRGPVFFVQRYGRNPFQWVGSAIAGEETATAKRRTEG